MGWTGRWDGFIDNTLDANLKPCVSLNLTTIPLSPCLPALAMRFISPVVLRGASLSPSLPLFLPSLFRSQALTGETILFPVAPPVGTVR